MTLQAFSFPLPETRLIRAGSFIYKFKIRAGSSYSGDDGVVGKFDEELEDIIRTVLGNLDSLQPFSSTHFNIFPYKKRWEGLSKVMCKHNQRKLRAYPFVLVLYLEKNTPSAKQAEEKLSTESVRARRRSGSEPHSKRCKTDSPLEEAIIKDLVMDMEAESKVFLTGLHQEHPHVEEEVADDPGRVDKQRESEKPQQRPGVNGRTGSVSPAEPGTLQDEGEDEGGTAEPGGSGILTRLASVFPFSLFLRKS